MVPEIVPVEKLDKLVGYLKMKFRNSFVVLIHPDEFNTWSEAEWYCKQKLSPAQSENALVITTLSKLSELMERERLKKMFFRKGRGCGTGFYLTDTPTYRECLSAYRENDKVIIELSAEKRTIEGGFQEIFRHQLLQLPVRKVEDLIRALKTTLLYL